MGDALAPWQNGENKDPRLLRPLDSMVTKLFRFLRRFLHRTRTVNNEPLNKVSLVVIILIDVVILSNVFIGLNDIAQWPIAPANPYPCYGEWSDYRSQTDETMTLKRDFEVVRSAARSNLDSFQQQFQQHRAKGS